MNDLRSIHETNLLDLVKSFTAPIYDVIDNRKDKDSPNDVNHIKFAGSLARATSAMTLVFPVLVSDVIDPKTAAMVTKAIERKCVSMMQIALSAFSMASAGDMVSFIKDFHTNVDAKKMDLDDYMDVARAVASNVFGENATIEDYYRLAAAVNEDCRKNINFTLGEDYNENSLADFRINRLGLNDVVSEMSSGGKGGKGNNGGDDEDQVRQFPTNHSTISSSDTKKANELPPSLLSVRVLLKDPSKEGRMQSRESMIGIKAKMYAVDSSAVCNKIINKAADHNIILSLVKVGTREISFFKDFLFAIDNAKLDIMAKSKKGSTNKLFKVLERRALNGKVRKALGRANTCKEIFTLIISREEAEWLKSTKGIDVDNEGTVIPMMESLNLMYFCIVDDTTQTVKFLLDGDTTYEELTFGSLEKETNDKQFNQLVNLVSQMNR